MGAMEKELKLMTRKDDKSLRGYHEVEKFLLETVKAKRKGFLESHTKA